MISELENDLLKKYKNFDRLKPSNGIAEQMASEVWENKLSTLSCDTSKGLNYISVLDKISQKFPLRTTYYEKPKEKKDYLETFKYHSGNALIYAAIGVLFVFEKAAVAIEKGSKRYLSEKRPDLLKVKGRTFPKP